MIMKIFKRNGQTREGQSHPVLDRLSRMGAHSANCTLVRTADGKETQDQIGPVSLFRKQDRLFTRGRSIYLVPPGNGEGDRSLPGRGEILNLEFNYDRVPYSVECQVVRRVRFSERLMSDMQPHIPVGYKLAPVGNVRKTSRRRSLRFGQLRTGGAPVVAPYFRFDLFIERLVVDVPPESRAPRILGYPGDSSVPEIAEACDSPEALVSLFQSMMLASPNGHQTVHVAQIVVDVRSGRSELLDIGTMPVLGLQGRPQSAHVHLKCPRASRAKEKHPSAALKEGDLLVLRFTSRDPFDGRDVHYRWTCRVTRRGIETLTLRPKGPIRKQTGLSVLVSDFSVNGVGLLNSPLLETYMLGGENVPDETEAVQEALVGRLMLMHFHPRPHFPKDLAVYRPDVPAAFPLLGEIVRTTLEKGKEVGRIRELGVAFRYEPENIDPETLAVTHWRPLRNMRENRHFKEIHRALSSLLAYLER